MSQPAPTYAEHRTTLKLVLDRKPDQETQTRDDANPATPARSQATRIAAALAGPLTSSAQKC
ncbi:MAG: hypothetical protein AAFY74_16220 [Pseudomonadota bacterium]